MTSRERFHETVGYGKPDRVPYLEDGIRREVLKKWHKQGLPKSADLSLMFPTDHREEIITDVDPLPALRRWPRKREDLSILKKRLNPNDPSRLPRFWNKRVRKWRNCDHILTLRVHRGFFLSLGVGNWSRFDEVIMLLQDDPDLIRESMEIQGHFAAQLAHHVLKEVKIDAAIFSEPIGGADRPILSPNMYEKFVLSSYQPLLDILRRYKVRTIILLTYANFKVLIPSILKFGFNCLWACETNSEEMDYRSLRREYGRDLRLIGGIDLDALRKDKSAIRREIEDKVPELIADGGYIPLADGRIRDDVPFQNYVYYRELLQKVTKT